MESGQYDFKNYVLIWNVNDFSENGENYPGKIYQTLKTATGVTIENNDSYKIHPLFTNVGTPNQMSVLLEGKNAGYIPTFYRVAISIESLGQPETVTSLMGSPGFSGLPLTSQALYTASNDNIEFETHTSPSLGENIMLVFKMDSVESNFFVLKENIETSEYEILTRHHRPTFNVEYQPIDYLTDKYSHQSEEYIWMPYFRNLMFYRG